VAVVSEKPVTPDSPEVVKIHGRTDNDGVLRLPVLDEKVTMKLKLDIGKSPPDDTEKSDPKSSSDEDGFMSFTLDGGELKLKSEELVMSEGEVLSDEKKLGIQQRLFNLGYGLSKLSEWTNDTFNNAVKRFQEHHNLSQKDGIVDPPFVAKLKDVHDTLTGKAADENSPART
jgi:hypothetical protein